MGPKGAGPFLCSPGDLRSGCRWLRRPPALAGGPPTGRRRPPGLSPLPGRTPHRTRTA